MLSGRLRVSVLSQTSLLRRSPAFLKPHVQKVKYSGHQSSGNSFFPFGAFTSFIKPALFTGIFVGSSVVIAEYATRQRRQGLWVHIKEKVNEVTRTFIPKGRGLTYSLIALNGAVLLFMHNPAANQVLARYFTHSVFNRRLSPLLLSCFGHSGFVHFGLNMYMLFNFMPNVQAALGGPERALALYLSAGVFSSFASHINMLLMRSTAAGLGASGAICGLFSAFCMIFPDVNLQLLILPGVNLKASEMIWVPIVIESLMLIFLRNKVAIDFAAHLGGFAFGGAYVWFLKQYYNNQQVRR